MTFFLVISVLLVVFLENEVLYSHSFPVSNDVLKDDFVLPIGVCKIERYLKGRRVFLRCVYNFSREGSDVTIVSFSKGVELSLEAAKELSALDVSAEVSPYLIKFGLFLRDRFKIQ